MRTSKSFFSIDHRLIPTNQELGFEVYINTSIRKGVEHFVRLMKRSESISDFDLVEVKKKYLQLYVLETERNLFLKCIAKNEDVPDVAKGNLFKNSAVTYLNEIFSLEKDFSTEVLSETIDNCRDAVEGMVDVIEDYTIKDLQGLIADLSFHDFYTYDHSINVSMYSISILKAINPEATRLELVHAGLGGLLHDIGKVKVPTEILNKIGRLDEDEYGEIKKHPRLGYLLLHQEGLDIAEELDLETIARVIYEHHENYDGTGYPRGLKSKQIHFHARICAIADFFDAITTKRSYSAVMPINQALDVMEQTSGKKIDPKIFDFFKKKMSYRAPERGAKRYKLEDAFDPTLPWDELPLEELEIEIDPKDFGKIRTLEDIEKRRKKK